jgi:hypothetical protein
MDFKYPIDDYHLPDCDTVSLSEGVADDLKDNIGQVDQEEDTLSHPVRLESSITLL